MPASHLHEFLCTWQRPWAGSVPEREHATLCACLDPELQPVSVPESLYETEPLTKLSAGFETGKPTSPEPAPVPKPRSVSRVTALALASEVLLRALCLLCHSCNRDSISSQYTLRHFPLYAHNRS